MSDYIKKEDAIASAKALLFCYGSDNITDEQLDEYAEEFMNDDNTIIEVVRCKDCKFWNKDENTLNNRGICDEWSDFEDSIIRYTNPDDYCSLGERKEQEDEQGDKSNL